MRGVRIVRIVLIVLAGLDGLVQAQQSWVIVPGQGWGPIALGMTETQVLAYFGPPLKVELVPTTSGIPGRAAKTVSFRTVLLFFEKVGEKYILTIINTRNASSATSEGIRVGSPIHDVLRAYGDWLIAGSRESNVVKGCMQMRAGTLAGSTPDRVTLTLTYVDRGIGFDFTPLIRGAPSIPRVDSMMVLQSKPCPPSH